MQGTLHNVYMAALLVSFGMKSLFGGGKFVQDENGYPSSFRGIILYLFLQNLFITFLSQLEHHPCGRR
jgi:hypothetical protein